MKNLTLILAASVLAGCGANAAPSSSRPTPMAGTATSTASALAFDPPIALHEPAPDLSRDARGQAALIGFEEPTTSTFDVFTYNRQSSDYSDYYDSEAVSEKVGTTHR